MAIFRVLIFVLIGGHILPSCCGVSELGHNGTTVRTSRKAMEYHSPPIDFSPDSHAGLPDLDPSFLPTVHRLDFRHDSTDLHGKQLSPRNPDRSKMLALQQSRLRRMSIVLGSFVTMLSTWIIRSVIVGMSRPKNKTLHLLAFLVQAV